MVSKKGSNRAVSKVSSAADPSAASMTVTAKKSSIIRSAFSPSEYQLALFASVIQGLDAHHLRIHNVSSGRLQCDHAVNPKESITSLDWGYYGDGQLGDRDQHMKKKRKRSSGVNGVAGGDAGSVVVAFGTSTSEVRMYCPAEDKIIGVLAGGHERGIRDFKFVWKKPAEGWSIGGDGKLVQWDLHNGRSVRTISLPSTAVSALARPVPTNPSVLCASQTPYLIDLENEANDSELFSSMKYAVHSLISSNTHYTDLSGPFLASDSDRYINIFNSQDKKLLGSLVADKEIDLVALYPGYHQGSTKTADPSHNQQLALITRDGAIEIFSNPFHKFVNAASPSKTTSLKSLRKSMTRRPDTIIKLVKPDKSRTPVPVVSVSFDGADLVVAWVEGGIDLVFDRIPWQNESTQELMYNGETELVRGTSSSTIGSSMMNETKNLGKSHVDESHAIVEQGGFAEEMSTELVKDATIPDSDDEVDSDEELDGAEPASKALTSVNEDVEMADHTDADDAAEPSFGELLAAVPQTIDVSASLVEKSTQLQSKLLPASSLPSGLSLSTVLSQSLKTNDTSLLESCLHTTDMAIVKTTIQRLDSALAATLLQKLAERLSTRPGRYGHLLMWVQWTCIAHGGSLAANPEVFKKISSLFKVMEQRAASLPSLLLLKGKLDMLDAQLALRQSLQANGGRTNADDDEERVIYVEGQEDLVEDDEEDDAVVKTMAQAQDLLEDNMFADKDGDEDMPMTNGVAYNDEEEDGEDEDDDEEMIDDEAEVSGDDDDDEEEEDSDEGLDEQEEASLLEFLANSDEEDEESDASDAATSKSKRK